MEQGAVMQATAICPTGLLVPGAALPLVAPGEAVGTDLLLLHAQSLLLEVDTDEV